MVETEIDPEIKQLISTMSYDEAMERAGIKVAKNRTVALIKLREHRNIGILALSTKFEKSSRWIGDTIGMDYGAVRRLCRQFEPGFRARNKALQDARNQRRRLARGGFKRNVMQPLTKKQQCKCYEKNHICGPDPLAWGHREFDDDLNCKDCKVSLTEFRQTYQRCSAK